MKFCHSKACGGHFSSRKTTAKILQSGFYWPTMFKDSHRESLDNLLLTFKSHHNGDVHRAIHDLWPHFYKEHAHHSLGNLTKKDPICSFKENWMGSLSPTYRGRLSRS
jgi:hypothetical protein